MRSILCHSFLSATIPLQKRMYFLTIETGIARFARTFLSQGEFMASERDRRSNRPLTPKASIAKIKGLPPQTSRALIDAHLSTIGAIRKHPDAAIRIVNQTGGLEHVSGPIANLIQQLREKTQFS